MKFIPPGQRYRGEDIAILKQRSVLYEEAKRRHPERWAGTTRNWTPEKTVYLNPKKSSQKEVKKMRAVA